MNRINLLWLLLFIGCLSKPKQPPLTTQETIFMDSLKNDCKCEVRREIDIMLLERFAKEHKKGGYALILNYDCINLKQLNNQQDSAKIRADQIANSLYTVLNHEPKFNEITISFTCSTNLENSSKYRDMFYNYSTDSLTQRR